MVNSTANRARTEAEAKARRRAEEASVVEGLRTIVEGDEQLLAFMRGRIAGGWRGKLTVGPEAFFAPFVNVGLTERRIIIQHIHPETGRPSEILPHFFSLADIDGLVFSDIETFTAEPAGRLILRLSRDQQFRIRFRGAGNVEGAQALADVFRSLTTSVRRTEQRPTQGVCAHCGHFLDGPFRFCPYCGQRQEEIFAQVAQPVTPGEEPHSVGSAAQAPEAGTEQVKVNTDAPVSDGMAASKEEPLTVETPGNEAVDLSEPGADFIDAMGTPGPLGGQEETARIEEVEEPIPLADPIEAAHIEGREEQEATVPERPTPPRPSSESRTSFSSTPQPSTSTSSMPRPPNAPPVSAKDGPLKIRIDIDRAPLIVHETFAGENSEVVVGKIKARIVRELPFALRLFVNSMSNLAFAQEVVRRYNQREQKSVPVPNTCREFLNTVEAMGYAKIETE